MTRSPNLATVATLATPQPDPAPRVPPPEITPGPVPEDLPGVGPDVVEPTVEPPREPTVDLPSSPSDEPQPMRGRAA
ncbi:hypothetical protein EYW49_03990 [Siculibacillus lacustris]|uniref:Uncharacterized protein n=1 Tax=Siculibacillus lacustris TaxID=1549641 RepID=A0A4Q9VVQ9_9HYPH|nr:hypothetical protein [Siculibacillus lacustris]TBW40352.1 hypothetical protein EYW49_03990 [Siculibacillus lacustris]